MKKSGCYKKVNSRKVIKEREKLKRKEKRKQNSHFFKILYSLWDKINESIIYSLLTIFLGIVVTASIFVLCFNTYIAHKYSIVLYPEDYNIVDISIEYTGGSNVNLHDQNTYTYKISYDINGKDYESSIESTNSNKYYKITKAKHSETTKILGKIGVNPKDKTDCHLLGPVKSKK